MAPLNVEEIDTHEEVVKFIASLPKVRTQQVLCNHAINIQCISKCYLMSNRQLWMSFRQSYTCTLRAHWSLSS